MIRQKTERQERRDADGNPYLVSKDYFVTEDGEAFTTYEKAERHEANLERERRRMQEWSSYRHSPPISWERKSNKQEREDEEADEIRQLIAKLLIPMPDSKTMFNQLKKREGSNFEFENFNIPDIEEPKEYEVKKGKGRKVFVLKGE